MKFVNRIKEALKSPFDHAPAHALYVTTVAQARMPWFYEHCQVPDTPEGRFDMVAVHTCLLIRRLQPDHSPQAADLAQAVFDILFADMDQNMREMSIGDTGVAKRIRKMAEGFYGRAAAYDAALTDSSDEPLNDVIDRNIYRNANATPKGLADMTRYIRSVAKHLDSLTIRDLYKGQVSFPAAG